MACWRGNKGVKRYLDLCSPDVIFTTLKAVKEVMQYYGETAF
jgi:hypothetical protein